MSDVVLDQGQGCHAVRNLFNRQCSWIRFASDSRPIRFLILVQSDSSGDYDGDDAVDDNSTLIVESTKLPGEVRSPCTRCSYVEPDCVSPCAQCLHKTTCLKPWFLSPRAPQHSANRVLLVGMLFSPPRDRQRTSPYVV